MKQFFGCGWRISAPFPVLLVGGMVGLRVGSRGWVVRQEKREGWKGGGVVVVGWISVLGVQEKGVFSFCALFSLQPCPLEHKSHSSCCSVSLSPSFGRQYNGVETLQNSPNKIISPGNVVQSPSP